MIFYGISRFFFFIWYVRARTDMIDGYRDEVVCDKLLNDRCYILARRQNSLVSGMHKDVWSKSLRWVLELSAHKGRANVHLKSK